MNPLGLFAGAAVYAGIPAGEAVQPSFLRGDFCLGDPQDPDRKGGTLRDRFAADAAVFDVDVFL